MEWKIEIKGNKQYVEVITSGIADKDGSLNMAKAIAHTMRTNRITKALIDHRNLTGVTGDTLDIYKRPKLFPIIGMLLKVRVAEIIKPEHRDHFRFFETVCINKGYQISIFQNKEQARSWLLE
jgi:hypothetical protein